MNRHEWTMLLLGVAWIIGTTIILIGCSSDPNAGIFPPNKAQMMEQIRSMRSATMWGD